MRLLGFFAGITIGLFILSVGTSVHAGQKSGILIRYCTDPTKGNVEGNCFEPEEWDENLQAYNFSKQQKAKMASDIEAVKQARQIKEQPQTRETEVTEPVRFRGVTDGPSGNPERAPPTPLALSPQAEFPDQTEIEARNRALGTGQVIKYCTDPKRPITCMFPEEWNGEFYVFSERQKKARDRDFEARGFPPSGRTAPAAAANTTASTTPHTTNVTHDPRALEPMPVVKMDTVAREFGLNTQPTCQSLRVKEQFREKNLKYGSEIFLRAFKSAGSEATDKVIGTPTDFGTHIPNHKRGWVEMWVKDGEQFRPFKTYPVCAFSGHLGRKKKEGDFQVPEGDYTLPLDKDHVKKGGKYHIKLELDYPNADDKAQKFDGSHIQIHGGCESDGCLAVGNGAVTEIKCALEESQKKAKVHIFPFPLTAANLQRHSQSEWAPFWNGLQTLYNPFAQNVSLDQTMTAFHRKPPQKVQPADIVFPGLGKVVEGYIVDLSAPPSFAIPRQP